MATVHEYWYGVIIELDHAETDKFTNVLSGAGLTQGAIVGALTAIGVSAAVAPIVAGAILLHLAWEIPAIRSLDQGEGVILTMPWPTPGLLIPATRHAQDLNQNWVSQGTGTFRTAHGDAIDYKVEHGAVGSGIVLFRLVDNCAWDKSFILRGTTGRTFDAKATRAAPVERSVPAAATQNRQLLTFAKPGFAGVWVDAFTVGGAAALAGGDRATFTWQRD